MELLEIVVDNLIERENDMSNYVWNKVICDKETLEKYFIDNNPFGDEIIEKPYITFNKIFGMGSLQDYREKVGKTIDYGYGFSYYPIDSDNYAILFCTRWNYPIQAIKKLLQLSNKTEWYLVEENYVYISKFCWENGVKEKVMWIRDGYDDWFISNEELYLDIKDPDSDVWYYLQAADETWLDWESNDQFKRYEEAAHNALHEDKSPF